jgi:protein SCO1
MISRKRMLALSAAAALVAVTAGCASSSAGTTTTGGSNDSTGLVQINTSKYKGDIITPEAKPVGTLTDEAGKPFNIRTMTKSTVTLLFFGYTHCPDECPLTMANTAAALRMLPAAEQAKIKVLFVSVDPGRDTLARLRSWLGNFYPAFIGLRAPLSAVEALERQVGLPIGPTFKDAAGQYQVDHATEMFAYSTDNLAYESFFPSTPPASMAHDLALLVTGHHP